MKQFHRNSALAILVFPFISTEMLLAAPPDPKLLALVPPGSQIVAGISEPTRRGQPDSFLLMNQNNVIDRRDFNSLAGVDDSKQMRQIIFASRGGNESKSREHTLLMSGHFDQARIFKAAIENGASVSEYKGFQVLVQQPFARELGTFKDVRWLAVIDSRVALFGTISSVQQELDRYFAGSGVDPALMQRLAHLRRDTAAWSVLEMSQFTVAIEGALGSLDPVLASPVRYGDSFQFGIRYRRKVEVEYAITEPSSAFTQAIADSAMQSLVSQNSNGFSLLSRPEQTGDRASVHGVVKVAKSRYTAWLSSFSGGAVQ